MFERVQYEDWHVVFPIAALVVAAVFFTIMSWRALRMKRPQVERLARLPLDEDATKTP